MGGGQSKPSSAAATAATAAATAAKENDATSSSSRGSSSTNESGGAASGAQGGGCPVKQGSGGGGFSGWFRGSSGGLPKGHPPAAASPSSEGGGCPVKGAGGQVQYNVYSQPIDPTFTRSLADGIAVYCVTVPSGVRPGDDFPVRADGRILMVHCPPGSRAGSKIQLTVKEEPDVARTKLPPPSEKMHMFRVVAPPGIRPGRPFQVLVEGKKVLVPCPPNATPGKTILFNLPSSLFSVANQLPHPSQKGELSTERVRSTIPKGGAEDGTTWTYPSPQMFYNSLASKGKLASDLGGSSSSSDDEDGNGNGDEDADEEAMMKSAVALHNNMNEKTWSKVLEWEAVSDPSGQSSGGPKLLKFLGRPSDLSPKARFKTWCLIHPLPFDRHDWTVVRPDGTEVRYVIDYYHDEARARTDEDSAMPDMHDRHAVKSILVDVRPAIDGPRSLFDRAIKMPYARRVAESTRFEPLPMSPTPQLRDQFVESMRTWQSIQENAKEDAEAARAVACRSDGKADDDGAGSAVATMPNKTILVGDTNDRDAEVKVTLSEAQSLSSSLKSMLESCGTERSSLESCADDAECARASLALTMCMGKSACPVQHAAVQASLLAEHDPNDAKAVEEYNARLDKALENVSACVARVSERAAVVRMVHPQAFDGDKDK